MTIKLSNTLFTVPGVGPLSIEHIAWRRDYLAHAFYNVAPPEQISDPDGNLTTIGTLGKGEIALLTALNNVNKCSRSGEQILLTDLENIKRLGIPVSEIYDAISHDLPVQTDKSLRSLDLATNSLKLCEKPEYAPGENPLDNNGVNDLIRRQHYLNLRIKTFVEISENSLKGDLEKLQEANTRFDIELKKALYRSDVCGEDVSNDTLGEFKGMALRGYDLSNLEQEQLPATN